MMLWDDAPEPPRDHWLRHVWWVIRQWAADCRYALGMILSVAGAWLMDADVHVTFHERDCIPVARGVSHE